MLIDVVDVNDNVPVFDSLDPKFDPIMIPEDTPNGTVIAHVRATDKDAGTKVALTKLIIYSIVIFP